LGHTDRNSSSYGRLRTNLRLEAGEGVLWTRHRPLSIIDSPDTGAEMESIVPTTPWRIHREWLVWLDAHSILVYTNV
jgi:hypothetical protein